MNKIGISNRQSKLLKLIIEDFITNGLPIGSNKLLTNNTNLNISTATIRSEMNKLEKFGLIEKSHVSSGRIPTLEGYNYFTNNMDKDSEDTKLENELKSIFAKRIVDIDEVIDEAITTLTYLTNMTFITTSLEANELLKSIQLVPLDQTNGTVIMVTSKGRVESKIINFNNKSDLNDIRIAIKIFNDRLIDTPLKLLNKKISILVPILENKIKNFEFVMQQFLTKVFNFHRLQSKKIYGESNIIKQNDVTKEHIIRIMNLLNTKSIWSTLEDHNDNDNDSENLKISINSDNTTVITKKMDINNMGKEISIIGTNRIHYKDAISILNTLEKLIKGVRNE